MKLNIRVVTFIGLLIIGQLFILSSVLTTPSENDDGKPPAAKASAWLSNTEDALAAKTKAGLSALRYGGRRHRNAQGDDVPDASHKTVDGAHHALEKGDDEAAQERYMDKMRNKHTVPGATAAVNNQENAKTQANEDPQETKAKLEKARAEEKAALERAQKRKATDERRRIREDAQRQRFSHLEKSLGVPTSLRSLKNAALVVLAYNRPQLLAETLRSLQDARLLDQLGGLFVSIDGDDVDTEATAMSFEKFTVLRHTDRLPKVIVDPRAKGEYQRKETTPTMHLARHYKWALDEILLSGKHKSKNNKNMKPKQSRNDRLNVPEENGDDLAKANANGRIDGDDEKRPAVSHFSHIIIVEDDLHVSEDFIQFFESVAPLLDADPTLWCASSWNDNGFSPRFFLPADQLFRTSYFPGLGWMLPGRIWAEELSETWPTDHWDHWMRGSTTHKGRDCISPYLPRNKNVGAEGATANSHFFNHYLRRAGFHTSGAAMDLGPLRKYVADDYDRKLLSLTHEDTREYVVAQELSDPDNYFKHGRKYLVGYTSDSFAPLGRAMQIHDAPRAEYKGTLRLFFRGADILFVDRRRSFFTPPRHRIIPALGVRIIAAPKGGVSCDETCANGFGVDAGRVVPPANLRPQGWGGGGENAEGAEQNTNNNAQNANNGQDGDAAVGAPGDGMPTTVFTPRTHRCDSGQFDFINSCAALSSAFGLCPNGCTQEWGEDIPNMELTGMGHPPRCLITEVAPTCSASHPMTRRLCPCVSDGIIHANGGQLEPRRKPRLSALASSGTRPSETCDKVCSASRLVCDQTQFAFINTCDALMHSPAMNCSRCVESLNPEAPSADTPATQDSTVETLFDGVAIRAKSITVESSVSTKKQFLSGAPPKSNANEQKTGEGDTRPLGLPFKRCFVSATGTVRSCGTPSGPFKRLCPCVPRS